MKYYTLKRETGGFDDILKDIGLKPHIKTKLFWYQHAIIGFDYETPEDVFSYLVLKYGENIVPDSFADRSPIPGKDYIPARKMRQRQKTDKST